MQTLKTWLSYFRSTTQSWAYTLNSYKGQAGDRAQGKISGAHRAQSVQIAFTQSGQEKDSQGSKVLRFQKSWKSRI